MFLPSAVEKVPLPDLILKCVGVGGGVAVFSHPGARTVRGGVAAPVPSACLLLSGWILGMSVSILISPHPPAVAVSEVFRKFPFVGK